jgi:hypothetical protein
MLRDGRRKRGAIVEIARNFSENAGKGTLALILEQFDGLQQSDSRLDERSQVAAEVDYLSRLYTEERRYYLVEPRLRLDLLKEHYLVVPVPERALGDVLVCGVDGARDLLTRGRESDVFV